MTNLNQAFVELIKVGVDALGKVTDHAQKAKIAAELAQAIASTGIVSALAETSIELTAEEAAETKQAIKEADPKATKKKKEAPAPKATPKEEPAPTPEEEPVPTPEEEPVQPDPEPVAVSEEDEGTEWTDELLDKYADKIAFIATLREEYGDDAQGVLDDCVVQFSEGIYKTTDDITPQNIVGFVAYLEMLLQDSE